MSPCRNIIAVSALVALPALSVAACFTFCCTIFSYFAVLDTFPVSCWPAGSLATAASAAAALQVPRSRIANSLAFLADKALSPSSSSSSTPVVVVLRGDQRVDMRKAIPSTLHTRAHYLLLCRRRCRPCLAPARCPAAAPAEHPCPPPPLPALSTLHNPPGPVVLPIKPVALPFAASCFAVAITACLSLHLESEVLCVLRTRVPAVFWARVSHAMGIICTASGLMSSYSCTNLEGMSQKTTSHCVNKPLDTIS